MKVEPYEEALHYATFRAWSEERKVGTLGPEFLPQTGFVVAGVAAGFLYRTDSKIAILESYIANPNTSAEERRAALDGISAALMAEAQRLGFKLVMAYTSLPAVVRLGERFGFSVVPEMFHCIAKNLDAD